MRLSTKRGTSPSLTRSLTKFFSINCASRQRACPFGVVRFSPIPKS
jgi:hypothetical protein